MRAPMATKYFPRDRRDLSLHMVNKAVANLFFMGIMLSLWKRENVKREDINNLAQSLHKVVARRHTHLWRKDGNGNYLADQTGDATKSSDEVGEDGGCLHGSDIV